MANIFLKVILMIGVFVSYCVCPEILDRFDFDELSSFSNPFSNSTEEDSSAPLTYLDLINQSLVYLNKDGHLIIKVSVYDGFDSDKLVVTGDPNLRIVLAFELGEMCTDEEKNEKVRYFMSDFLSVPVENIEITETKEDDRTLKINILGYDLHKVAEYIFESNRKKDYSSELIVTPFAT